MSQEQQDPIVEAVASGDAPQASDQNKEQTDLDAIAEEVESELEASSDSKDDSSDEEKAIDNAEKAGNISKKDAKELKKMLKLKVDGQEIEEEIDFNDEEGLKKHLQKSKAFDKRLKEFSSFKSQVDTLLEQLKNDPESVLEKLGYNVDDMAEKRLAKKIEEMKKSPEEIEKEKMAKELEDLRKEKKRIEEEKQKAELEKMRNEQAQQIETDISEALESTKSILPKKNPLVMQRIAQTMLMAMQNGYESVTAKDVIPLVEKQWREELNSLFDVLPEETLEMLVGKSNLDRYRKTRISANKPKPKTETVKQLVKDTGIKNQPESSKTEPKKFNKVFDWRS